jgi:hypothetical protein
MERQNKKQKQTFDFEEGCFKEMLADGVRYASLISGVALATSDWTMLNGDYKACGLALAGLAYVGAEAVKSALKSKRERTRLNTLETGLQ